MSIGSRGSEHCFKDPGIREYTVQGLRTFSQYLVSLQEQTYIQKQNLILYQL